MPACIIPARLSCPERVVKGRHPRRKRSNLKKAARIHYVFSKVSTVRVPLDSVQLNMVINVVRALEQVCS